MRMRLVAAGLVAGACVLSLAFAGGAEQAKEAAPESGGPDLKAAVADLTKRVADLEKRTRLLEAGQHTFVIGPGMVPDQKSIPKDWKKQEFNGMTFYIVPLGEK